MEPENIIYGCFQNSFIYTSGLCAEVRNGNGNSLHGPLGFLFFPNVQLIYPKEYLFSPTGCLFNELKTGLSILFPTDLA